MNLNGYPKFYPRLNKNGLKKKWNQEIILVLKTLSFSP